MDKLTEKILTTDSIAETEQILCKKHYSEFSEDDICFCLAKTKIDNEIKYRHLQNIGDTHFRMTWDEFKEKLLVEGFKIGLSEEFNFEREKKIVKEEEIIYYYPEKGMVIYANSFSEKQSINEGSLYAEIQANTKEDGRTICKWISTGGMINEKKLIYKTSHDVREGLFSKLKILESAGVFLKKWTDDDRFLWFLNYTEKNDYDYKKITQSKIERCPQELREIIGR